MCGVCTHTIICIFCVSACVCGRWWLNANSINILCTNCAQTNRDVERAAGVCSRLLLPHTRNSIHIDLVDGHDSAKFVLHCYMEICMLHIRVCYKLLYVDQRYNYMNVEYVFLNTWCTLTDAFALLLFVYMCVNVTMIRTAMVLLVCWIWARHFGDFWCVRFLYLCVNSLCVLQHRTTMCDWSYVCVVTYACMIKCVCAYAIFCK